MTAVIAHNLGFPRIEGNRDLEKTQATYWRDDINQQQLADAGRELRKIYWKLQADAGLELIPTGDFSWYDQMLALSATLGNTATTPSTVKWFDTDYHYLAPEFHSNQKFQLSWTHIIGETAEAIALGYKVKPVIMGPLSYLYLGEENFEGFDRFDLLENILPAYQQLLATIATTGAEWVQIDEPILVLNLPTKWQRAFESIYNRLQQNKLKVLLTTYFGSLGDNLSTAIHLPVAGLHIDAVCAPEQVLPVIDRLPAYKILSIGVIDDRISRNDLKKSLTLLQQAQERLGNRLWIAPSYSLLHSPNNIEYEKRLPIDIENWLSSVKQKLLEVVKLKTLLNHQEMI